MTFDDSLPTLVGVLLTKLDADAIGRGVCLRDVTGCLAFFAGDPLDDAAAEELRTALTRGLGRYARPDRVLALPGAPGAARVLAEPSYSLQVDGCQVRIVDRRVVGADWLRVAQEPSSASPVEQTDIQVVQSVMEPRTPARFVFASVKGGVGRSTALSVVATRLADAGRKLLVVDLDLEAPGIGSLLVPTAEKPRYGALDYLVELNFGPVEIALDDFIASRTSAKGGSIDVVPVAGSRSDSAPGNYMAKLARAMTEAVPEDPSTPPLSLAGKVLRMLESFEARGTYDVVLIDARAGLAEVAAAPLLHLGAQVLLFATAQTQTLEDLRFLLAHLRTLTSSDGSPAAAFKMIHAKARTKDATQEFKEQLWELFGEYVYEREAESEPALEAFNFDADDESAPHFPIIIPLESAFHDYDPFTGDSPLDAYFDRTFKDLFSYVVERLETA